MGDPTEAFFADLARRGHEPLLGNVTGSVRIEVSRRGHTEGWTLMIKQGDLRVSRAKRAACHLSTDRALFNRIVTGRTNATAAVLRGAIAVRGDIELLVMFQRLLPGRDP